MRAKHGIFIRVGTTIVAGALMLGGCASSTSMNGTTATEADSTGTSTQSNGEPQMMLNQAKAKWERAALHNYSYRFERSCFCPEEWRKAAIVTVLNDSVASARYVEPDEQVPTEKIERYQSVDRLFAILQEAIDRKAQRMEITYDPTYGYPATAMIDYDERLADEEMRFTAGELKPIR